MGFVRKYLSADGLIKIIRHSLRQERFNECRSEYSWQDCIMSGLAVFGFKMPSLLQFEKAKWDEPWIRHNLRTLYGVEKAPSDTCMRERLDTILPSQLRKSYKKIFAYLQRGKALEVFRYLDGHHIISVDGTGQYCSEKVHCENCCEKHHRNAAKRLLSDLRREHPHLKILIVEDALAANYPHLALLDSLKMNYVIGVKEGDHAYLFDWIKDLRPAVHEQIAPNGSHHHFQYYEDVPLNDAHHDYRVNVIRYWEITKSGKKLYFSWITRFKITPQNVYQLMRAGRCRWRIENETFNTLKNQGYNFEHNYGHGYKNLCSVMTMLMMLAFLIDQVQQLCCKTYQKARKHVGTLRTLFEKVRNRIDIGVWDSWHQLYTFIGDPSSRPPPGQGPIGWMVMS